MAQLSSVFIFLQLACSFVKLVQVHVNLNKCCHSSSTDSFSVYSKVVVVVLVVGWGMVPTGGLYPCTSVCLATSLLIAEHNVPAQGAHNVPEGTRNSKKSQHQQATNKKKQKNKACKQIQNSREELPNLSCNSQTYIALVLITQIHVLYKCGITSMGSKQAFQQSRVYC